MKFCGEKAIQKIYETVTKILLSENFGKQFDPLLVNFLFITQADKLFLIAKKHKKWMLKSLYILTRTRTCVRPEILKTAAVYSLAFFVVKPFLMNCRWHLNLFLFLQTALSWCALKWEYANSEKPKLISFYETLKYSAVVGPKWVKTLNWYDGFKVKFCYCYNSKLWQVTLTNHITGQERPFIQVAVSDCRITPPWNCGMKLYSSGRILG